jgi:hypothetical protein
MVGLGTDYIPAVIKTASVEDFIDWFDLARITNPRQRGIPKPFTSIISLGLLQLFLIRYLNNTIMKKLTLTFAFVLGVLCTHSQVLELKVFSIDNNIYFFEEDGEKLNMVKYYASLCLRYEKRFFRTCSDPIYLSWDYHPTNTSDLYSIGWENMKRNKEVDLKRIDNCPICKLGIRIELPMRWGEEENLIRILAYGLNNRSELIRLRDSMIVNELDYHACRISAARMEEILKSDLTKKQFRFIKRFNSRFNSDKVHLVNPYLKNQ